MTTIVIVTFALTISIVVGLYWAFVERPDVVRERRIQRRLAPEGARLIQQVLVMPERSLSALNWLDKGLVRISRIVEPLRQTIDRSALRLTVGAVVLMSALLALTLGLVTAYFISVPGVPIL